MTHCTASNHLQENRKPAALKLAKQAVEILEGEGGRPKMVAEACATLADMYFAADQLEEAEATVCLSMVTCTLFLFPFLCCFCCPFLCRLCNLERVACCRAVSLRLHPLHVSCCFLGFI